MNSIQSIPTHSWRENRGIFLTVKEEHPVNRSKQSTCWWLYYVNILRLIDWDELRCNWQQPQRGNIAGQYNIRTHHLRADVGKWKGSWINFPQGVALATVRFARMPWSDFYRFPLCCNLFQGTIKSAPVKHPSNAAVIIVTFGEIFQGIPKSVVTATIHSRPN